MARPTISYELIVVSLSNFARRIVLVQITSAPFTLLFKSAAFENLLADNNRNVAFVTGAADMFVEQMLGWMFQAVIKFWHYERGR